MALQVRRVITGHDGALTGCVSGRDSAGSRSLHGSLYGSSRGSRRNAPFDACEKAPAILQELCLHGHFLKGVIHIPLVLLMTVWKPFHLPTIIGFA